MDTIINLLTVFDIQSHCYMAYLEDFRSYYHSLPVYLLTEFAVVDEYIYMTPEEVTRLLSCDFVLLLARNFRTRR